MSKWMEIEYLGRHDWDDGLATFHFAHPSPNFTAGQFLTIALPDDGGKLIPRAYSIGSAPGEDFELYIVRVDGGALTPRLFALHPGDMVSVRPKFAGHFTLNRVGPAENLWLAGTGTGLAPYISMLREGSLWNDYQRVVVYHGVRHGAQLAYRKELEDLAERFKGRFFYLPTVSREEVLGALHGRVTTTIAEAEELVGAPITPETTRFMLCGNRAMLTDMIARLGERGLKRALKSKPGEIHAEVYF